MIRVFAVGSPRSGTTLLQRLLAEHLGLLTQRETFLVPRVQSPSRWLRRLGVAGRGAVEAASASVGRPVGPVAVWDRRRTVAVVRAAVAAMDRGAAEVGAAGWVEKTPRHLRQVALLTKACTPRFVHIVRDGADVVVSIVAVTERSPERWGGSRSARDAARRWAADVDEHRRWAGHPDHAFVRYEDLVSDPHRWMAGAARWLGVDDPVARRVTHDEIAPGAEAWKLTAFGPVSADTTSATIDRAAAAQALRDDPVIGPVLDAATRAAAGLPYGHFLEPPDGEAEDRPVRAGRGRRRSGR